MSSIFQTPPPLTNYPAALLSIWLAGGGVNDPCFVSLISSVLCSPPNHPPVPCHSSAHSPSSLSPPLYFFFALALPRYVVSMQCSRKLKKNAAKVKVKCELGVSPSAGHKQINKYFYIIVDLQQNKSMSALSLKHHLFLTAMAFRAH